MISVFDYSNYRSFIQDRFQAMPKAGYGQSLKLAQFLDVHTTLVSQALKGIKSFTMEQASQICEFLGLNDFETEYFLALVQLDRAGNESLKKNLRRQLSAMKEKSQQLVHRMPPQKKLTEEQRAVFYSDWSYAAVRQQTALPGDHSIESIAEAFDLSQKKAREIIEFLLRAGLAKEEKGSLKIGPCSTHVENSSPWGRLHHLNWRQKAIESLGSEEENELHYTAPMTLAKNDVVKIRELIVQFLESMDRVVGPSPSEEIHCLNIDWFKIGSN